MSPAYLEHDVSDDESEDEEEIELDLATRIKMRFPYNKPVLDRERGVTVIQDQSESCGKILEKAGPSQIVLPEGKSNINGTRVSLKKNFKKHGISDDDDDDDLPDLNDIIISPAKDPGVASTSKIQQDNNISSASNNQYIYDCNSSDSNDSSKFVREIFNIDFGSSKTPSLGESGSSGSSKYASKSSDIDFGASKTKFLYECGSSGSSKYASKLSDIDFGASISHFLGKSNSSGSSKFSPNSKEAKICEKEIKKRERERKKEEKELLKKQKQEEKLLKRAFRPGECLKYISVQIDPDLLHVPEGSELIARLLEREIKYEPVEQIVPNSISFFRRDPISGEKQNEMELIVIINVDDFLNQVSNQIYGVGDLVENTLISSCKNWRSITGISRITIVVCGVDEFFKKQKTTNRKNVRKNNLKDTGHTSKQARKRRKNDEADSNLSKISRIDVETALVAIQVELGINSRLFESPSKIADFVAQVAKAVAEKPFKLEKAETNFTWHAESSNVNCVKVSKSGEGLLKLWHQQLRQFNNVGPEAAQAIAKKYPSPQSLIQVYRTLPEAEGLKLLADIPVRRGVGVLANTRKIGPELSSKIYKFLMYEDPDVLL